MTTPPTPVPTGRAGVALELLGVLLLLLGVIAVVTAAAITNPCLGLAVGGAVAAVIGYLMASTPTDGA